MFLLRHPGISSDCISQKAPYHFLHHLQKTHSARMRFLFFRLTYFYDSVTYELCRYLQVPCWMESGKGFFQNGL